MLITRTPLRVSFAGGGTDLSEYYSNYSGSVVSSSINKYVYINSGPTYPRDISARHIRATSTGRAARYVDMSI